MARVRIVFMGTPDLAATCLSTLVEAANVDVLAAVSQPDRPKGRHLHLHPTPVKAAAQRAGVPVLQPVSARETDFLDALRELQPDLIAVAAYGQILPQTLLDIPKHGCLNVHTSLLPRYRGAAPIQWAILNGDRETGVTIMKIVQELDAGDIVSQTRTTITEDDNAQTLYDRLAQMGAALLLQTIPDYITGNVKPLPQATDGVVHARKITRADGRVDWTRAAREIWNQIRGLIPWPGAFTHLPHTPDPLLLKLWRATPEDGSGEPGTVIQAGKDGIVIACGTDTLRIHEVQPEGRRRMTAEAFLAGNPLKAGDRVVGTSEG